MGRVKKYSLAAVLVAVTVLASLQAASQRSAALVVATISADEAKALQSSLVPAFEREHGQSVRVISLFDNAPDDFRATGYHAVRDILTTADVVMNVPLDFLPRLIEEGLVAPLDPHLPESSDTVLARPVLTPLRRLGNGRLYGISPTFSAAALVINLDLFERIGMDPPQHRLSWGDVSSLCETIRRRLPDQYACMSFGPTSYDLAFLSFRRFLKQRGLPLVQDKTINPSAEFSNLWLWYLTMLSTHHVPNFGGNEFWQGRIAMALFDVPPLTDQANFPGRKQFRIRVLPAPYFADAPKIGMGSPHDVIVISRNSKRTTAAWTFIWEVLSSAYKDLIATSQGTPLSALPTLYTEDFRRLFQARYTFDPLPLYQQDGIPIDTAPNPPPEVLSKLDFLGLDLMVRVLYGDIRPTDALNIFRERGTALIAGGIQ